MATAGPSLGRAIKHARTERGLSQAELARALGIQQNVLARLEDGGRADPRLSTIVAVTQALGISIDELVAEAGLTPHPVRPAVARELLATTALAARTAREQLAELDATLEQLAPAAPSPRAGRAPSRRKQS
jgi:transcriptional regulator with XRE-family HTH domain